MSGRGSCALRLGCKPRAKRAQLIERAQAQDAVARSQHLARSRHENSRVVAGDVDQTDAGATRDLEIAESLFGRCVLRHDERFEHGAVEVRPMIVRGRVAFEEGGCFFDFSRPAEQQNFVAGEAREVR